MNLPLFVAKRYFFTKSKASFITFISRISMLGVGVEVMALILILSVFNGLEEFQKGLFKTYDPDLKVISTQNTRFTLTAQQLKDVKSLEGIRFVNPILEDQALIRYKNKQLVVRFKGVDDEFLKAERLKKQVVEGDYFVQNGEHAFAVVGIGVFLNMGMSFEDVFTPIEAWYPNHQALKRFTINEQSIRSNRFFPSGVMEVEQSFDNQMILVPLPWMEELMGVENQISALEIMIDEHADEQALKSKIATLLGKTYQVQTRDEQHVALLKAIKIEKFFVFLIMAFVMGIASFTLFYALSLLVIEKKKDLSTLLAMGFTKKQMFQTFLLVGVLISFSGAIIGMLLGYGLGYIQQEFGVISLGIPNSLIDAYPIQMRIGDFIQTALVVIIITFLASIFPARKAVEMTFKRL
ncbi:ABC transporter permease [Aquirufa nivalisilvae]|uniref:ABC transporter permease n=1 Tax=Aquirufa nivalisilvae TaxID=2516557 RepID=UPI0022A9BB7F|nr:FtsX-like permease family protein [Aquirufa nivalisilvae]MCZ2480805.1 ABC transporter permease [Aquirufa nivalisilvae]